MGRKNETIASSNLAGVVCRTAAVVFLLFTTTRLSMAAEFSMEPIANIMAEYNDNRRLTTGPHEANTGYVVDASLPLAVQTPVSAINLTPRIRNQRYRDGNLDSDDYYLNLQAHLDAPRTHWQLDAARSWTSTLTTEYLDVGLVDVYRRRNGRNFYPSVTQNLTERTSIQFGGGYEDVTYDNAQGTGLVDSTYGTVDTTLSYMVTERATLSLTGYLNKMEAVQIGNETRNSGGQLGLNYKFSEQSLLTLGYGYRRTDYEIADPRYGASGSSNGRIYSASWQHQGETSTLTFNISQNVLPSGYGYLVEHNEGRVAYDQRWSERMSAQVSILGFQDRGLSVATQDGDRNYVSTNIGLRWRMSSFWALTATYTHASQLYIGAPESAQQNILLLGVNYAGQRRSLSQ